jgi:hypothetical protein
VEKLLANAWWRIKNWNWTAIGTCAIAAVTIFIFVVSLYQWGTFQDQLTVMQGQLSAMQADQRPWIKIEKVVPSTSTTDPQYGGLRFPGPDTFGFLPLDFLLKNVGRSPALDVRVRIGQFFWHSQERDLAKEEQDACASVDSAYPPTPMVVDSTDLIRVIFPGDEVTYNNGALIISAAQMNKLAGCGKMQYLRSAL